MKNAIMSAFAGALLLACAPAHAADATHGKQVFVTKGCYACHGYEGQGGVGLKLSNPPLPAEVIALYIRNPTGEMPPFTSKEISDADIRDIAAYLTTVPKPPKLADVPLLN
jgi:ubiquinol-cytochrome c reductase cytochrome c subunit